MAFEIKLNQKQTKQAHDEWIAAGKNGGMMLAQVHTQCMGLPCIRGAILVNILSAEEARAVNTLLTGIRSQKSALQNAQDQTRRENT